MSVSDGVPIATPGWKQCVQPYMPANLCDDKSMNWFGGGEWSNYPGHWWCFRDMSDKFDDYSKYFGYCMDWVNKGNGNVPAGGAYREGWCGGWPYGQMGGCLEWPLAPLPLPLHPPGPRQLIPLVFNNITTGWLLNGAFIFALIGALYWYGFRQ